MLKNLNREQRLKVYRKALSLYRTAHVNRTSGECDGMCGYIDMAMEKLGYNTENRVTPANTFDVPRNGERKRLKEAFPEFVSFMPNPNKRWPEDRSYWFTRKIKKGGHLHRIKILTALAEGKSAGDM